LPDPRPIFEKNRSFFDFFRHDFSPTGDIGTEQVAPAQLSSFISHTPHETSLQL
jgi:hypothetical protein